jgi:feruloyl esterase
MLFAKREFRQGWIGRAGRALAIAATLAAMAATSQQAVAAVPACDDTIKASFKPDAETRVVEVTYFHKGDNLPPAGPMGMGAPSVLAGNVCMVKVVVGPGNPGPAGAPSTSPGIGIEIWLPDAVSWNGRFHAIGGGGWQGGPAGVAGKVASSEAAMVAGTEGAVSSTTDTGHAVPSGSFAMLPDGSINSRLWADFASRAIHEQAVKSKALAKLYYGTAPRFSYWEGGSTGGRQGLNLAQNHPEDFDGIISMYPAINWTRFITSELYPQVVIQRDLGGRALAKRQLDMVSNAAIAACDSVGGEHMGYVIDPSRCRYDPVRDRAVLCVAAGGTNDTADCLGIAQARAVNKIWYGMTSDGSVPDPAIDNGWNAARPVGMVAKGRQRWFGLSRGTTLYLPYPGFEGLANPDAPFSIATHVVALEMQDPTIAAPGFSNATGNGQSKWKQLTYGQLSAAYDRGLALQERFGNVNTDRPDLGAFAKRGGKLLTWHGLSDEVIPSPGTINYYNSVARTMGGLDRLRSFYRFYLVPGLGHGTPNGTSNRNAMIPNFAPGQMYALITAWVENKTPPPGPVVLNAGQGDAARSMPVCPYPEVITYDRGSPKLASSYHCAMPGR